MDVNPMERISPWMSAHAFGDINVTKSFTSPLILRIPFGLVSPLTIFQLSLKKCFATSANQDISRRPEYFDVIQRGQSQQVPLKPSARAAERVVVVVAVA